MKEQGWPSDREDRWKRWLVGGYWKKREWDGCGLLDLRQTDPMVIGW